MDRDHDPEPTFGDRHDVSETFLPTGEVRLVTVPGGMNFHHGRPYPDKEIREVKWRSLDGRRERWYPLG